VKRFTSAGSVRMTPPGDSIVGTTMDRSWKGEALKEVRGRPANSPFWESTIGNLAVRLALNTETGIYTANIRIGSRGGAAAEDTDPDAAIQAAINSYAARSDRTRPGGNLTAAEKIELVSLRDRVR
jgi:hypothetical protein